MSYGFLPEPTLPEHWTLGSGKASEKFGAIALMPHGHGWGKYIPKKEIQRRGPLETMACTVFGSANCWETLANYFGFKDFPRDLAERYNAVLAKITPQGGSPHQSAETFRLFGGIPEESLPFSDDIRSWEYFYSPNPMDEDFVRLGQTLLTKYVMGHEWIFNGNNISRNEKHDKIKQALTRGTVAVSVYAWNLHKDRYIQSNSDNHWVQLVDYKEGDYWLVNDHYEPTEKKLDWDTNFYCAKLFFLKKNPTGLPPHWLDYLFWLVKKGRAKEALSLVFNKPMETPSVSPKTNPHSEFGSDNAEHLYLKAKSFLGIDLTPEDKIPDFVACVAQFQALHFKTFGRYVGNSAALYNTKALRDALNADKEYIPVSWEETKPGDVCVFATGESKNPAIHNGHVFVVGKNQWMSNNSYTGLWEPHKTKQQVYDYYISYGRFTPYVFRPK